MLSQDFAALISPFKQIANRAALSATYRSLELSEKTIRGCSGFAMMEVHGDFGIPAGKPFYVDALSFIAVVGSLPRDQEVKLALTDGVFEWSCGSAKGRLALASIDNMPKISHANSPEAWIPVAEFKAALQLGTISCGSESLASVGLYGVVIDNRDDLCIYSSDSATVSACWVMEGGLNAPALMVLSPEAALLLATLVPLGGDKAKLEFDETSIYYRDGTRRALIKQLAPLKHDIAALLSEYGSADTAVDLPVERVNSFIKRIGAIAESKKTNYVLVGASKGKLTMSFSDGIASSEEYYLVDELEVPDLPTIKLDAVKMGRALQHIQRIALDHIERGVLVLHGDDPMFQYILSGSQG
jgi:hypothetical protein